MKWLLALIPDQVKVWLILGLAAAVVGGVGYVLYKTDKTGYDRCEAEHKNAEAAAKDDARGKIIGSGKKYDETKKNVAKQIGPNDLVGPRVSTAIDSLP